MVAVIKTGHSLGRILNYNENKVTEGKAQCIGQGNYPMETDQMNFAMKYNRLARQAELNPNVTRNSVHISLNFDTSETNLEKEKLMRIAAEYMDNIGFGKQPYLVYQHHDAGHPHIHIVSVKVKADGRRIDMQNIGRNQSEKARKLIEKKYGLVEAGSNKTEEQKTGSPALTKVIYGKNDTRRAISNIVDAVTKNYRFTSLHELNAVLRQYNVMADRGSEKSRVYQNKGLMYRILDEKGNKTGVPVKASAIYSKPTLAFLEKQFPVNEMARSKYKVHVKNAVDLRLAVLQPPDLSQLCKSLEKDGIQIVLRQNDAGRIYGITYIDHTTKCVFNGSALGKTYSAQGIMQRCSSQDSKGIKDKIETKTAHIQSNDLMDVSKTGSRILEQTAGALFKTENPGDYMPNKYKKRKKKRGQSDNR
ncbi:relaxase/mobilization nuclease domain-containing protein [Flavobacterium sp. fv08]|uniref:relaxase/mobilization nuclease domain-containing protein n=1 Tax=Flavobacterium sp. fv08 TaxID=1761784 RepID=UPI000B80F980|nr:relaxase/mobilization nuclease domain-containing protein [Flavobacterium sp. fv08]